MEVFKAIVEVGQENGGAVTSSLLMERGVGESAMSRKVQSGELVRLVKGTYLVPALWKPLSPAYAMQLRYPRGALCRYSAAQLFDFPLPSDVEIRFLVPHSTSVSVEGIRLHETRNLPEDDVRVIDGLRVTSPARTICDIAPDLPAKRLRHVLETQLSKQAPSEAALIACLSERVRRGVHGMRELAELVSHMLDDQPFPESVLETLLHEALVEVGMDQLQRQFRPSWYDGIRGIVDFADPEARTIIEADGRGFRKVTQSHDNDRRRDRIAAANGFVVLRVGYRELQERRQTVTDEIAQVVAARRLYLRSAA